MKESGFRLSIRKKLLPVRVGRPWHRVPKAAVAGPGSLELSQARLDRAWSSLGQWKVSLPMGGLWIIFSVPSSNPAQWVVLWFSEAGDGGTGQGSSEDVQSGICCSWKGK